MTVLVRVIAGHVNGLVGPVRERPTAPLLLSAALEDERPFELDTPEGHTAFVFVASGRPEIGPENASTPVSAGTMLLLAAARPLGEPVVQRGPFVMNTEAEIRRAFADHRAGVLDKS